MSRQVYTLNEPVHIIQKLHRAGLSLVRDITSLSSPSLSSIAHISTTEAEALLRRLSRVPILTSCVTSSLTSQPSIVTFSRRLDRLLGGGLPLGKLTQITAPPGGGKTQLCLQACIDAAMPAELGGLSACSIFIDTEDTFHPKRLLSLAEAAVSHCHRVANDVETKRAAEAFTIEVALSRVKVISAFSQEDLLVMPSILMDEMKEGDVRVVVVDSVAAPFRGDGISASSATASAVTTTVSASSITGGAFSRSSVAMSTSTSGSVTIGEGSNDDVGVGESAKRTAHLQWLAGELRRLARRHAAAIIVTNHVTTVVEENGSYLVPALGASWQHCPNVHLYLESSGTYRIARLLKHPDRKEATTVFQILEVGIRDVCDDVAALHDDVESDLSDEELAEEDDACLNGSECDTADASSMESDSESLVIGHRKDANSTGVGTSSKQNVEEREPGENEQISVRTQGAVDGFSSSNKRRRVL